MRSEDEVVDALRRAHRVAADQVDERPDAAVRAAVLAAATRAVGAKPRSIAKPPGDARVVTRRWPLSAAAVLMVSAVTALLASQILRDAPERVTTIASVTPQPPRTEAPPAAPTIAVPPPAPAKNAAIDERIPVRQARPAPEAKVARPPSSDRQSVIRSRPLEHEAQAEPGEHAAPSPSPTTPPLSSRAAAPDRAKASPAGDDLSADEARARAP